MNTYPSPRFTPLVILLTAAAMSALAQTRVTNGDYYRGDRLGPSSGGNSGGSGLQQQQAEQERQRQARFQQQQRAAQALGQGLTSAFQSLLTPNPSHNDDDLGDDDDTYVSFEMPTRIENAYGVVPPVTRLTPPPPAPARPLFDESLSSFVGLGHGGGTSGSGAAGGHDSLSSLLGSSATPRPKSDFSISPELDRFVRDDIARQHAYFDDLARQTGQNASGRNELGLPGGLPESAKSLLRDIRGEPVADVLQGIPSGVVGRYQPEVKDQALASLEGTKLEFLTHGRRIIDPSQAGAESFARDLRSVGGASKELRYKVLGELAQDHREDTMGTAPLLSSWIEYGETATGEALTGWNGKSPSKILYDAGGKVRDAWKDFLDQNLNFADPKDR